MGELRRCIICLVYTDSTRSYRLNICRHILCSSYLARTGHTYRLLIGDVGGQKTLRSYWRNYFEKTDALIWVVDATDRLRVDDCRTELHLLLQEEASIITIAGDALLTKKQRLMGASLLVFSNKTDIAGCMEDDEIRTVRSVTLWGILRLMSPGSGIG